MKRSSVNVALARWMATHDGVISSAEVAALGAPVAVTHALVASGQWQRPHRGVYVTSSVAAGPRTDLRVALALGAGAHGTAVASHRSAAWLWGLIDRAPPRPHITVPAGRRLHVAGIVSHRTSMMPTPRQRGGIPVTDPIRTLIDLAAKGIPMTTMIDRALALCLVTVPRLDQATRADPGSLLAGRAALRQGLLERGYWGAPNPSVLESHMARLFERMNAGAAVPYPEAELCWQDGRYRLDFAWPVPGLAVEVDGYVWHAGAEQLDHDNARRAELTAAGWTILTFTWRQVVDDPGTVMEAVTRTYRRLAAGRTGPEGIPERKDQLSGRKC